MKKLLITLTQLLILTVFRIFYAGRVNTTVIGEVISTRPVVIAANHVKMLDPFIIACFLPLMTIFKVFPYNFMVANVYYYQLWQPIAWLAGCFPAKSRNEAEKPVRYGVGAGVKTLRQNYSLVMFPEGKRTHKPLEAKPGISRILDQSDAPLVLCYIHWDRAGLLRRVNLNLKLASDEVERTNPAAIMQAVYKLGEKNK